MPYRPRWKSTLYASTALIGVAVLALQTAPAYADILVNNTNRVTTANLGSAENLTVTGTGTISASPAASINNVTAGSIQNQGTMNGSNGITLTTGVLSSGLTNSGQINGTFYAIYLGKGTIVGGLTNSGTIEGGGFGVRLNNTSVLDGGLINSGTITSYTNNRGIYIGNSTFSGGLTNSGFIGGVAAAVGVASGTLAGGLTNTGTISSVVGIEISSSSFPSILNGIGGTIQGTGGTAITLSPNSNTNITLAGGRVIGNITDAAATSGYSRVSVSGPFTTEGNFTVSDFDIASGGTLTLGSHTISSRGTMSVDGTLITGASSAINLNSAGNLVINNTGTLDVRNTFLITNGDLMMNGTLLVGNTGTLSERTRVTGTGVSIVNSGTMQGGTIHAIILSNGALSGGLTNSGTITGGSGVSAVSSSNIATTFINSGTIIATTRGINLNAGNASITGGLTNSGVIQAGTLGFFLNAGAYLNNGLTNSGTITAGQTAIFVQGTASLNGGITNSGTITGTTAVRLSSSGAALIDSIINATGGTIHGTGGTAISLSGLDVATPIIVSGGRIIGHVTDAAPNGGYSRVTVNGAFSTEGNFTISDFDVATGGVLTLGNSNTISSQGTMSVDGTLIAAGTPVLNLNSLGNLVINNAGTLDVRNTLAVTNGNLAMNGTLLVTSTGYLNESVTVSGTASTVKNSGTIAGVRAIDLTGGRTITAGLTNSGTIIGSSRGINFITNGRLLGGLTNSGTISGAFGIYAYNASTIAGGLTNTGSIIGTGTGIHFFVNNTISGGLTNSGLIRGGNAAILINGSAIPSLINLTGGTIQGTGATAISMSGLGTASNITLAGGRVIGHVTDATATGGYSNVTVTGGIATEGNFTVSDFDIASGGTLTLGGTNTISSNANMGVGGTLITTGTPVLNLNSVGNLVINNSGTLDVRNSFAVTGGGLTMNGTLLINASGSLGEMPYITGAAVSVKNSGTIGGAGMGVWMVTGGTLTSGLTNSGTITGTSRGVYMNQSIINGGITNSGYITGANNGIRLVNAASIAGDVTNSGTLSAGNGGSGFSMHNSATASGAFINSNLITAGNASAKGILLDGAARIVGGITNSGTITADNTGTGVSLSSSQTTNFLNLAAGTIIGGSGNGGGVVIGGTGTGYIIDNRGRIVGGSNGMALSGPARGSVVNTGVIVANSYYGILMQSSAKFSITNSGSIIGNSAGIHLRNTGPSITGGLTNSGLIQGKVGIEVNSASAAAADSIINLAGGTINGTTGTAISLSGLDSTTSITLSGGRIIGHVTDAAPAGGFSKVDVTGDFGTEDNFTVSDFQITGAHLTINAGDLITSQTNIGNSGTISISVTDSSNASGYGRWIVSNGAIDLTDTTLRVNVTGGANLTAGDEMLIFDSSITPVGGPGATPTAVLDNNVYWNFLIVDGNGGNTPTNDTDLFLQVVAANPIIVDTALTDQLILIDGNAVDVTPTGSIITTDDEAILISGVTVDMINNDGTLSGSDNGIMINNATLTGGITSSGVISADSYGLRLTNSSMAGGLANSGTIGGGVSGFVLHSSNITGGLTNSGTISADMISAVYLSSGFLGGGLINMGLLQGNAHGINSYDGSTLTGGLTNSGTITGINGTGIYMHDSLLGDGLTNGGTIIGVAYGVQLDVGSTLDGGLTNSGTISGGSGVNLFGNILNDGFANSGLIEGDNGIYLQSSGSLYGGLTNSGAIDGDTNGVYLFNSYLTGDVTNSGTISGSINGMSLANSIADGLTNSGTLHGGFGGISLSNGSTMGDITNYALINGDNTGVYVVNSTLAGLVNSGTINGPGLSGIYLANSLLDNGLTNSGTIDGDYSGVYLQNGSTLDGGLTNSGTIIDGIMIDATSVIDSIKLNGGRIIGDVVDTAPVTGSDVIVAGDFTTEGNFDVSSLTVNNTHSFIISSGNTFTSHNNAVINGTLAFEIVDMSSYGSLIITYGTADLTNATITISAVSATLANGDQIRIINGDAALIGGPGTTKTTVTDNSFLWDFRIFDGTAAVTATDNTDLFVEAMQVGSAEEAATTPNNAEVAIVFDSLSGTPDTTLQQIISNLNAAPTQEVVNDILESTTSTIDTAVSDSVTAIAHQSVDLIQTRISDLRAGSGISTGALTDSLSIWGQVFGQHASQDERDNIPGYDANTFGMVVGVDTDQLFDNATIGIAASYGNSAIKSQDANDTRTDIDSYQIGLYSNYSLPQDYFISGSLGYGYNDIASTRFDVGAIDGLNANADYKANQYTAHIETGKDFHIKPAYMPTITPTLEATYTHLSPDSYTETGAGGASLTVETDSIESFELGGAIKSQWDIKQSDGALLSPSIHAGYRYDLIGDTIQATSNFTGGGASFNTQGADPAKGTTNIGAGLKYQATNNWTFSASYDFEVKQDYTAHAGILRAGYGF